MSESELYTLLCSVLTQVAYDHFDTKVEPPFILYRNTDTTTMSADDHTIWKNNNYIVDLVTDIKDPTTENQLETEFNENYLPFDKEEDFIESEKIYQIRYYI